MSKGVYNKKEIEEIKLKREIKALSTLLVNINEEEPLVLDKIKTKKPNINYNQSFLLLSNIQVYKTYSILGIAENFKLNTKYFVIDIGMLLDIWFNHSNLIDKSILLECDILIIKGKAISFQADTKATALIELVSSRKTLNKITWIYAEDTTLDSFNTLYPGVSDIVNNKYQISITVNDIE